MEIELPENVTKMLIYCSDPRITAWQLGDFGIYQETFRTIPSKKNLKEDSPVLVQVKYEDLQDVMDFIAQSQLRAIRLFKTAIYSDKLPAGFLYTAAKNLLALFAETKGEKKVFRINSSKKELRNKFYEVATKINDEFKYNHGFDFDQYDIEFVLKEFSLGDGKRKLLVTYFYGKDYPNLREGEVE